jgi:ubiquitin C-terminal hydrolase
MELRGIGCYRPGLRRQRTAVGHYYAVCKSGNSWKLFDDMKKHSTPMKSATIVPCEYLIYLHY